MFIACNKGFSLTELLVTLVVSGVLVIGVVSGYVVHKRSYEYEEGIRDMQMNAQVAMDHVKQLLLTAGLGCEANFPPLGSDILAGAFRNPSHIFTAINRTNGPDTLTAVTGLRNRTLINGSSQGDVIALASVNGFNMESGRYIFIGPSMDNRYLEIIEINGLLVTVSDSLQVNDGDQVFRVNAHTITLDKNGDGSFMDVDGDGITSDRDGDTTPDLYICDNMEDVTSESVYEVAEGIEDIQFEYGWDADKSGDIEAAEWVDDPAGNEDEIRAVRIYILARALLPDPAYEDPSGAYTVADHVIPLDLNDSNGIDSNFDHHYHRTLLVETIMVRNKNL